MALFIQATRGKREVLLTSETFGVGLMPRLAPVSNAPVP